MVRIGIIGDYDASYVSHRETGAALEAATRRLGVEVQYEWVATDAIAAEGAGILDAFDGLWAAPGSPYRSMEGAIAGIRYARERGRPYVGT